MPWETCNLEGMNSVSSGIRVCTHDSEPDPDSDQAVHRGTEHDQMASMKSRANRYYEYPSASDH
jgi:hypothetical protein